MAEAVNYAGKDRAVIDTSSNESLDIVKKEIKESKPKHAALIGRIKSLNPEARVELLALMWLGAGVQEGATFTDLIRQAQDEIDRLNLEYIAGKATFSSYLEAGLRIIRRNN